MMTVAVPIQDRVDQIAQSLAPDVRRILCKVGQDQSVHPSIYFRVVLSDDAAHPDRLRLITAKVRSKLTNDFDLELSESDRLPYVRFRGLTEQANFRDPAWE